METFSHRSEGPDLSPSSEQGGMREILIGRSPSGVGKRCYAMHYPLSCPKKNCLLAAFLWHITDVPVSHHLGQFISRTLQAQQKQSRQLPAVCAVSTSSGATSCSLVVNAFNGSFLTWQDQAL